jgi:hypothetical protein
MTSPQSPFIGEERGFGVDIASDYNVRGELTVGSYGPGQRTYDISVTDEKVITMNHDSE